MKALSLTFVAAILLACSSEKDDVSTAADAGGSCTNLCAKAGFTSGRADVQPHEINCFCTGTGTVAPADCTSMCKALGKPAGQVFGTNKENCQCQ